MAQGRLGRYHAGRELRVRGAELAELMRRPATVAAVGVNTVARAFAWVLTIVRLGALVIAVAVLASSGCATVWAGIQLSGSKTYSTDGSEKRVTPVGDRERKLDVEIRSLSPLALGCTLSERNQREHVEEVWHRWGYGWHMVGGFAFVAESIVATAAIIGSVGDNRRNWQLGLGSYLALDALVTGVLLLTLDPESSTSQYDYAGEWSTRATCPEAMFVLAGDQAVPVGVDGQLAAEPAAAIGQAMIETGAPLQLQWSGRLEVLRPSVEQRCEWTRSRGDPIAQAICPLPPPAPMAPPPAYGAAPLPPPPLPPLRLRIELIVPIGR